MRLVTVLATMVQGMPEDASVTLTVAWLRRVLKAEQELSNSQEDLLTLPEVGARLGRSVSTVRAWCSSGRLRGAFRLNGREWRVPTESINKFLEAQQNPRSPLAPSIGPAAEDLSAWRRLRAPGGSQ